MNRYIFTSECTTKPQSGLRKFRLKRWLTAMVGKCRIYYCWITSTFFIDFPDIWAQFALLLTLMLARIKSHLWFYMKRSSRPKVFCEKGVLKYFTKFTGKHLWGLFFNKVAGVRRFHRCFSVNFAKFMTPFFYRAPFVAASGEYTPWKSVSGPVLLSLQIFNFIDTLNLKYLAYCQILR